jgi:hypothetical protein
MRILIYEYSGCLRPVRDTLIYVNADRKHPDPFRRMIWGVDASGETVIDYKDFFRLVRGKDIPTYDRPTWAAIQRRKKEGQILREFARLDQQEATK